MRILAYIGTFNETVERPLTGLLRQTRPPSGILIVDNASTRLIPDEPTAPGVHLVRNHENLGPSGAIRTGLEYATEHGYDWLWIFDADSGPREDALEKLCEMYRTLPPNTQRETGILSCSHILVPSERRLTGRSFTRGGPRPARSTGDSDHYECDAVIWSGSLYRLDVVREVGMPRCGPAGFWDDLGHDYGDLEFSNRVRRAGYRIIVHKRSLVEQSVGDSKEVSLLGLSAISTNHPAERRYLYFRNLVFFWLYIYPRHNWVMLGIWFSYRLTVTMVKILAVEQNRLEKINACLNGAYDGFRKRMSRRFPRVANSA